MGLDMYLNRRCVKGKVDTDKIRQMTWGLPYSVRDKMGNWSELVYWRKANMIHNWFVENVQNGKDDCNEYPVTRDQIVALFERCLKAAHVIQQGKFVLHYYGKPKDKKEPWNRPVIRVPAKLVKPIAAKDYITVTKKQSGDGKTEVNEYGLYQQALDDAAEKLGKVLGRSVSKGSKFWLLDSATTKKLSAILPTAEGFFFGTTSYGVYYIEDIFDTIVKLREAIDEMDMAEMETQEAIKWAKESAKGDPKKLAKFMKEVPQFTYSYCASW